MISGIQACPRILRVVRLADEQRAIHVRKHLVVDELVNDVLVAAEDTLGGPVDLAVVGGVPVGEVDRDDEVVLVGGEVEKVLCMVSGPRKVS